jgi:hypothetical protein
MTAASSMMVVTPLSPEDLVHMVDVSIVSKYRVDLTQFMLEVAEDMRNTLDAFKHDLESSLPRQVWTLVQQINGEVQGKRVEASSAIPSPGLTVGQGNQGILVNVS